MDQTAINAARAAMDGFMAAFNARDIDALRDRWFHFPHVRFHSGKVTVWQTPEDYTAASVGEHRAAVAAQWDGWAGTAWDYVEPIDAADGPGGGKVHFRVQFTRRRGDGSVIGSFKSLYIVTFQHGRWAIQGRSSWAG
jgi:hypothetical protein